MTDSSTAECEWCGDPFVTGPRKRTFCSDVCKLAKAKGALRASHRKRIGEDRLLDENRYLDLEGYVRLHEPAITEHKFVMEQKMGRELASHESVHHMNGIRTDNSPDNLELWCRPQPAGQRVSDLIEWVVNAYSASVRAILGTHQ